ncbi:hypothetical protein Bca52824_046875 [Brassica carinata]|uniref:Small EDRK-rich factor-like N-terminal domain-containing protein n=1 Tax=Brassica carinata TaxID=52824 RepID=A0A8X7UST6_BRACI|nr:hypothetical protein Bca52824_046875 [Brassica carinata]
MQAPKTSNLPPVVLPNNNPAPSVRDYPPPRQLFPCSTFQPSGSAPVPQTQPPTRVPQSSGGEGNSYPQPGQRQSQSPPLEESPSSPLHAAPSPHSSQAQNSHGDPEDFAEFEAPVEPDLSEDVMDVLNRMLAEPGREEFTTVLSPKLEPGTTCQRERDRERAAARAGGKGKNADDGLTPEQRRERDGKALQEKAAKKAAQAAAAAGSGGGTGGKGTAKK